MESLNKRWKRIFSEFKHYVNNGTNLTKKQIHQKKVICLRWLNRLTIDFKQEICRHRLTNEDKVTNDSIRSGKQALTEKGKKKISEIAHSNIDCNNNIVIKINNKTGTERNNRKESSYETKFQTEEIQAKIVDSYVKTRPIFEEKEEQYERLKNKLLFSKQPIIDFCDVERKENGEEAFFFVKLLLAVLGGIFIYAASDIIQSKVLAKTMYDAVTKGAVIRQYKIISNFVKKSFARIDEALVTNMYTTVNYGVCLTKELEYYYSLLRGEIL